ncbi:MAG: hypothetical protein JNL70_19365 [Saprospiraceae bacterium]|nr:hypothetical protein [Saprospiraceae bacterium]
MKIHSFFLFTTMLFITSCHAQASLITISECQKGNTGHRGIIPQGEENKPMEGKDYYRLTLTINKDCTLELSYLTVKTQEGQANLKIKFDDDKTKKAFKKDEKAYLYVEKEKNTQLIKSSIGGEGNLAIKINGKLKRIPIKEFVMILPM